METLQLKNRIALEVEKLTYFQQEKLLDFIKSLGSTISKGKHGILNVAGSINKDELEIMSRAIEEDCEKINPDEW